MLMVHVADFSNKQKRRQERMQTQAMETMATLS